VALDGSDSSDPEGMPLSYRYELTKVLRNSETGATADGSGLNAALSATNQATCSLQIDPDQEARYTVSLVVSDGMAESNEATAVITTRFLPFRPPTGFAIQRLTNDLIFTKYYVNDLSWTVNPENQSRLTGYRLYRKAKGAADSAYTLLAELGPETRSYRDDNLKAADQFTYRLTAVNFRNLESDPVEIGN